MVRHVIIGGGIAGITAAEAVRERDPEAEIDVYSGEDSLMYYRPGLIDVLGGRKTFDEIIIHPQEWYDQRRIRVRLDSMARMVNSKERFVEFLSGSAVRYDRLLLADGSFPFLPPALRDGPTGVFTVRNTRDMRKTMDFMKDVSSVVVVGAGLLGLELGAALRERGMQVTMVESSSRILPNQLDEAGAAILQRRLEAAGIRFHLNAAAEGYLRDGPAVRGIVLKVGQVAMGAMVLISSGISPRLGLAKAAGCKTNVGVVVDLGMRTSVDGVWAAGDSAEVDGRCWGIWPASRMMGRIAGLNMAGGSETFANQVPQTVLKVTGILQGSLGNIDAQEKLESAVFKTSDMYRKIVFQNGKIAGAVFLGTLQGYVEVKRAMERGIQVSKHIGRMADPGFDFSVLES